MSTPKTYQVHASRVGKWWEITIPGIYGNDPCGQARHLTDVVYEARTIIAAKLDVPLSAVNTQLVVDDFGDAHDIQKRAERISELRTTIDRLSSELHSAQRSLVTELRRAEVPEADVAALLGVTRQRIGQLSR
jgi:hypothetical protein